LLRFYAKPNICLQDELKKIIYDVKERLHTMESSGSETSPRRKQQRKLEVKT